MTTCLPDSSCLTSCLLIQVPSTPYSPRTRCLSDPGWGSASPTCICCSYPGEDGPPLSGGVHTSCEACIPFGQEGLSGYEYTECSIRVAATVARGRGWASWHRPSAKRAICAGNGWQSKNEDRRGRLSEARELAWRGERGVSGGCCQGIP